MSETHSFHLRDAVFFKEIVLVQNIKYSLQKNMEFLLTYSMLFCRQLQCLNKYFFDKSFWQGSALQVRCSFQAVKLRYKPLQYSCQKVVCFWQCKLVNNQHSFQKSTNSYCSWKVFFAFKTSFPEVLAPLQKTKNIKQIIRKVLQESWLSLGFNKTLNIRTRNIQKHAVPEILRLGF